MTSYVLSAYSFDIGDVLAVARCRIEPDELRPELESKLAKIGADLMLQVIKDMASHYVRLTPSVVPNGMESAKTLRNLVHQEY